MPKWIKTLFLGCGCGCLGLMIVLFVITSRGCMALKESVEDFEQAVQTREQVEGRFGNPDAFTPWLDGAIPADRIETFLEVRRDSQLARDAFAAKLSQIEANIENPDLGGNPVRATLRVFEIISGGIGMLAEMGDFISARNESLLTREMGMGEYTYLYSTVYYAWLGHDVEDGNLRNVQINTVKKNTISFGKTDDEDSLNPDLQKHLRSMISNWLGVLGKEGDPELRLLLEAELAALREDDLRIPWQEQLPEVLENSLAPYRESLESLYVPMTNPFETVRLNQEGDMEFGPAN
jgi:hypothetical protein